MCKSRTSQVIPQLYFHSEQDSDVLLHRSTNAVFTGGCGQMFEAVIVSPQFAKKTTLARHRLVNGTLKDEIAAIHAWTPKCFTPEEWKKKKDDAS